MKVIVVYIITFFMFWFNEVNLLRKHYQTAQNNKESALVFYTSTNKINTTDPVLLAYKAAGKMLQSKYEKGKQQKKELFKEGATNLNELVKNNPNNIEIRFIRLTIQQNTPALLKYNTNIDEDKTFILYQYKNADANLQTFIKRYVVDSKKFNATEVKTIN